MQFKRILASVLSAVCICSCFGTAASADTADIYSLVGSVSPMYEIADKAYVDLSFIGDEAVCTSSASGDNAASITVTQTLQKYWGLWVWNDVKGASWTKTENKAYIRLSNSKSGLENGKYRVKSVFTFVDKQGKTEKITVYSDEESI